MATDLRFAFICQQNWQDLLGDDAVSRFCLECAREVVNLDSMAESERDQFFGEAVRTGKRPCVSATVPVENANPCKTSRPVAGMLVYPDQVEKRVAPPLDDDHDDDYAQLDLGSLDTDDEIKLDEDARDDRGHGRGRDVEEDGHVLADASCHDEQVPDPE